jgi:hypothetical protein
MFANWRYGGLPIVRITLAYSPRSGWRWVLRTNKTTRVQRGFGSRPAAISDLQSFLENHSTTTLEQA